MVTTVNVDRELLEGLKRNMGERTVTGAIRKIVQMFLFNEEEKQELSGFDVRISELNAELTQVQLKREGFLKEVLESKMTKREKAQKGANLQEYVARLNEFIRTKDWKFVLTDEDEIKVCDDSTRNQFEKAIKDFRETLSSEEQLRLEPKMFVEKMLALLENRVETPTSSTNEI